MYLALKEIRHEKLRYGLIIAMVTLIAYLIFILTSLAFGLAGENTQAINSWDAKSVVLNKDSNINLSQSTITNVQAKRILDWINTGGRKIQRQGKDFRTICWN